MFSELTVHPNIRRPCYACSAHRLLGLACKGDEKTRRNVPDVDDPLLRSTLAASAPIVSSLYSPVYTIQPVVKTVVKPVIQPVVQLV